ncbi:MAG: helix-turn-helix domain-containing protein [Methylophilaceae bacterium]|nr:helix-turn-helix domain-containing protein [Methylophilaceae bacterium]NOT69167.1 helix-turn-helix domain-containing protein [Methylophilaceae bacterium]
MKHYKQLTSELRYQIYGLKQAGLKRAEIAEEIGVNKSTITREFKRNQGRYMSTKLSH